MLRTEDRFFLKQLVRNAFSLSFSEKEVDEEKIVGDTERELERVNNYYYNDVVVYSFVELALFREGYQKEAEMFNRIWWEYHFCLAREFKGEIR